MGWEDALDALVRERGPALVGHAYLLTGDVREAEDLVQDALVRVFARGRPVTEIRSAEAYVRRAIHTIYLDGFRRRRHWATIRHLAAVRDVAPEPTPELLVGHRLALTDALATLSPRQRACVVLHHVEDLPVDEIAAQLSLSPGAVKRYLSDGRRALRAVLAEGERGAGGPADPGTSRTGPATGPAARPSSEPNALRLADELPVQPAPAMPERIRLIERRNR